LESQLNNFDIKSVIYGRNEQPTIEVNQLRTKAQI